MSRRAKLMFLFSVGTVLNLLGYLYLTGSWQVFFAPSTPKGVFQPNVVPEKKKNIERELLQLLDMAVRDHQLSQMNITSLIDKFMKEKFKSEDAASKGGLAEGDFNGVGTNKEGGPGKRGVDVQDAGDKAALEDKKRNVIVHKMKPTEVIVNPPVKKAEEEPKKGLFKSVVDKFMNDKVEKPVNPHDFNYMINEPGKCKNPDGSDKDVFLLVLICSVHKNFENRNAIRQSWGSPVVVGDNNVITMFLLAKRSDSKLQNLVVEENEQYHDIIMEDFDDTYKNLTLKTTMGMKWMSMFCSHAEYMMKTDDDMYVSYSNVVKYLNLSPDKNFVTGMVINGAPIRDPKSKWYMPKSVYPGSKYPPFCSGTGYILSGDVPPQIYHTSLSTPYLYLEDVYVAICIDKLHILPKNHREFHNWRTTYTFCHFKRILTAHMVTPTEMIRYWNDQNTNKHTC